MLQPSINSTYYECTFEIHAFGFLEKAYLRVDDTNIKLMNRSYCNSNYEWKNDS